MKGTPLRIAAVFAGSLAIVADDRYSPAHYVDGGLPALPALAVGGAEVLLDVGVSAEGRVTGVTPLRVTKPFAATLTAAVRDWRFTPAQEEAAAAGEPPIRTPVPSHVLVAGVLRPPALSGPTIGAAPTDVGRPLPDIPFPTATTVPIFPVNAASPGLVLVEIRIDAEGRLADARVVRSLRPFDEAALSAVRQWTFRPANVRGKPVSSLAYVVFGFPLPVTGKARHSPFGHPI
jgi:TonB family protein